MPTLPSLPVEVWRYIFSLVLRVPGVLLADRPDPFSECRGVDICWSTRPSSRTALLLVSKHWCSIASELIYEHIHLTLPEQIVAVADRFEQSRARDIRPLGSRTRRVDVQLRNPHPDDAKHLARLLRCTPSLEIFINSNCYVSVTPNGQAVLSPTQTPTEVMRALVATCVRTLRRVEWTCHECPSWSDLIDLLRRSRSLRSLTLASIHGEKPGQVHLALPNLRTLILGDSPSFSHSSRGNAPLIDLLLMLSQSSDQLPSLHRLEGFSPSCPDFLRTHGHKIRIVRTLPCTPLLPDIIARCPNLEMLVTIFPDQQLENLCHPSLKRIGIFPIHEDLVGVPTHIFPAYVMKPLEDLMCQIEESDFPKLRQVRIRNTGTLAGVIEHVVFIEKWQERWSSRGVLFDDKDGNPFQSALPRGDGDDNEDSGEEEEEEEEEDLTADPDTPEDGSKNVLPLVP